MSFVSASNGLDHDLRFMNRSKKMFRLSYSFWFLIGWWIGDKNKFPTYMNHSNRIFGVNIRSKYKIFDLPILFLKYYGNQTHFSRKIQLQFTNWSMNLFLQRKHNMVFAVAVTLTVRYTSCGNNEPNYVYFPDVRNFLRQCWWCWSHFVDCVRIERWLTSNLRVSLILVFDFFNVNVDVLKIFFIFCAKKKITFVDGVKMAMAIGEWQTMN